MASHWLLKIKYLKFILLGIIIQVHARYPKYDRKAIFHRTDIRFSKHGELQATGYCSSKEECCMRCSYKKNCSGVRLFPLEDGFLAEYLSTEAAFDDKLRVYEDLNSKFK